MYRETVIRLARESGFDDPVRFFRRFPYVQKLERFAAAVEANCVPQWQPIETAPRDGTYILVATEHGSWVAKYQAVFQSGFVPDNPWRSMMLNHDHIKRKHRTQQPTEWMPLPSAPAPKDES